MLVKWLANILNTYVRSPLIIWYEFIFCCSKKKVDIELHHSQGSDEEWNNEARPWPMGSRCPCGAPARAAATYRVFTADSAAKDSPNPARSLRVSVASNRSLSSTLACSIKPKIIVKNKLKNYKGFQDISTHWSKGTDFNRLSFVLANTALGKWIRTDCEHFLSASSWPFPPLQKTSQHPSSRNTTSHQMMVAIIIFRIYKDQALWEVRFQEDLELGVLRWGCCCQREVSGPLMLRDIECSPFLRLSKENARVDYRPHPT